MDLNSVSITARATKDTELKTTTTGTNIATISVAVNGMKDEVSYFDVVCFGKTAEIAAQYAVKGKQLGISGRLQQRKWQDKDGNNRYSVEIVANQVKLLGSSSEKPNNSNDVVIEDISDEPINLSDIPF